MNNSLMTRIAAVCFGAAILVGSAQAQTSLCEDYRAELRNLERGGGQNYADMAEQQRAELNRMVRYYQQLDCDRGRSLFDAPPSSECAAARDRIEAMEENYNLLIRQASQASEDRRQELLAAIARHCEPRQARRGFLDGLFGRDDPGFDQEEDMPLLDDTFARRAGAEPICVRSCDGYFFPLFARGVSADEAERLCQAQCPNAPTRLFYMSGDSELESAIGADGMTYTSLPNAFRYRTTFDPTCSCHREDESWSEALSGAQRMIGTREDDILVDTALARELSLPGVLREAARARRLEQEAATEVFDEAAQEAARRSEEAPTSGDESAGIRIDGLERDRVVTREEGEEAPAPGSGQGYVPADRAPVRIVSPDSMPPSDAR